MEKIKEAPAYTENIFRWKYKWRLSRKDFLIQSLGYWIPSIIALSMIWNSETWDMAWIIWTVFWVSLIPMFIVTHIKRFHDLGYSWWWVLLEFGFFLNIIIWPLLYFLRWDYWPNLYWFDPLIDYEKQKKLVEVKDGVLLVKKMKIIGENPKIVKKENSKAKKADKIKKIEKPKPKENIDDDWDF